MKEALAATGAVHGRVDAQGRLLTADPPLAGLHARAGGKEGGVIAVPQLAALARLASRLGILVSRGVIAADGEQDLDLWVRAQPDGETVRLAIAGWTPRPAAAPFPAPAVLREDDFQRAIADWMWETDEALRLTALSPAAGPAALALIGQPLTRLFALVESADGALPILEALALKRRFDGQRAAVRGEEREVVLSGTPLLDAQGRFAGFKGMARTGAPAEAAEPPPEPEPEPAPISAPPAAPLAPVDGFGLRLDGALRGPLDRIIANAETITERAEGPLRSDYADYAADIASAGRHLLALVDDLVDLQAIERPGFRLDAQPIDLADAARRAAGLLGGRAAERDVRIDGPAEGEPLPARGDFRRALQILTNLIANAVRYSPPGGAVWIRCEREGDLAALIVADQGKGIAEADQQRIFEKFERVDPREPGGTGLGLYIARRLARAMDGDLAVDSAPGQGARFVLTLPAA